MTVEKRMRRAMRKALERGLDPRNSLDAFGRTYERQERDRLRRKAEREAERLEYEDDYIPMFLRKQAE